MRRNRGCCSLRRGHDGNQCAYESNIKTACSAQNRHAQFTPMRPFHALLTEHHVFLGSKRLRKEMHIFFRMAITSN